MISEWWTYRPEDFLLFSERAYFRLFELHNASVWPAQIVALILGAIVLAAVLRPTPNSNRLIAVLVAAAWIFVAWAFLWNSYASINWAVRSVAPLFVAQALLLVWLGGVRNRLSFDARSGTGSRVGLALFACALVIYPLSVLPDGRPFTAAEVFGITADPTAVGTLGIVLMADGGWRSRLLRVIPLVWCALSAAVLLTMGVWQGWVMIAVIVLVPVASLLARRTAMAPDTPDRQHDAVAE